jgi:hypothetical protein
VNPPLGRASRSANDAAELRRAFNQAYWDLSVLVPFGPLSIASLQFSQAVSAIYTLEIRKRPTDEFASAREIEVSTHTAFVTALRNYLLQGAMSGS